MGSLFEITKRSDNRCRFVLKSGNGRVLLTGVTEYSSLDTCYNGVESVRSNAIDLNNYTILNSLNGPFFILKSHNGKIIGCGKSYCCLKACKKGIFNIINILSSLVVTSCIVLEQKDKSFILSLWRRLKDKVSRRMVRIAIEKGRFYCSKGLLLLINSKK